MKIQRETLKELGKSFFNLANMLIALSIINLNFSPKDVHFQFIIILIVYVIFIFYVGGIILLNKGSKDD